MSIASVPEHALALLVDDLAPLHDGKVVGALRRGVGVGAHEAVLPGLAVDLLADNAGRQPLPALGLGGRMNAEALVLHRLAFLGGGLGRSEEHTSELQSLMRISYAVFCLTKKTNKQ